MSPLHRAVIVDLRVAVRARMDALGLDTQALAERMAMVWVRADGRPIKVASAKTKIDRWFDEGPRHQDMTTRPFGAMLDVLGMTVGIPAQDTPGAP